MKTIYIPLGSNCEVGQCLRTIGLRNEAFPFDWNCSSLKSVYEVLSNNFEHFLDDIYIGEIVKRFYFEEMDNNNFDLTICNEYIYPVICERYSILFPHDYKLVDQNSLESVKEKYKRRIDRFRFYVNRVNDSNKMDDSNIQIFMIYCNSNFILNDWQESVYNKYNIDINELRNDNHIYLEKIKNMYQNKKHIKIMSLDEFRQVYIHH